jgi:homoserine kinase type II
MAVYTEVSDKSLKAFVAQYDIGKIQSCKGIAEGVENTNYHLQTSRGSYILTLYEKRVNPADLPFFLGLMDYLAGKGFPCPTPIHGIDGKSLRTLSDKPAALISFLSGLWPKDITPSHCYDIGVAAAQMHIAAEGFSLKRKNRLNKPAWKKLFYETEKQADKIKVGLADIIKEELEFLDNNWPNELPRGIIHADLFPDNVFFLQHKLSGIIDFYFACNEFFAYELAICLNAWCFETDGRFNTAKAANLVGGYISIRPLNIHEINALPVLARGSSLRFLLTRLFDMLNQSEGALVTPKDPLEYLRKLEFHQKISGAQEYGISSG